MTELNLPDQTDLIQSFEIDGEGNIKFTLKPKSRDDIKQKMDAIAFIGKYLEHCDMEKQILFAYLVGEQLSANQTLGSALMNAAVNFDGVCQEYETAQAGSFSKERLAEYEKPPQTMTEFITERHAAKS